MRIFLAVIFLLINTDEIVSKDLPIRFFVANHKEKCTGMIDQMCLLMKNSPSGEWKTYSTEVEGFDYQEGYDYEILVNKIAVENPPEDESSFKYKLISIKKKIPTMIITDVNRERLDRKVFIISRIRMNDKLTNVANTPECFIQFDLTENLISGKDGCNDITGKVIINRSKMTISDLASTRMFCENVIIDKFFHELIKKVNKYKIKNNKLKLYEDKRLLIELIPSESDKVDFK